MNTTEQWWNYKPLTDQGSRTIKVLLRDKVEGIIRGERDIPRAMLARLMHEDKVFAEHGKFIVEI